MKYTLSILIPARNEEWLARTVQDILAHRKGATEIIIGLDGEWANPTVNQHPDVTVVYYGASIGQRAMTNQLCKLSKAKYVMKADAHTAWDEGFDVKMIEMFEKEGDNIVGVPTMRNLHAFDWLCKNGHRRYQSPSGVCKECGEPTIKDVVWNPKPNPQSTSYCFDPEPHFQYFNDYKAKQVGDYVETMSLQGSAFMLTREKYWELNICDESFGSWGSQGIEVAVKMWTSGGRVLVNKKTWYAHLFRTQGGDFSFPYKLNQSDVNKAKSLAKARFLGNSWGDKQIYPISWLIEKFSPVYKWTEKDLLDLKQSEKHFKPEKEILYYTDNNLKWDIAKKCRNRLMEIGLPIISVSRKSAAIGKNIVVKGERSPLQMYRQILAGLKESSAKYIFLCEHDVLYDPSHFDFTPPNDTNFYFNTNVWKVRYEDGFAVHYSGMLQNSGICADRKLLVHWVQSKVEQCEREEFDRHYEPTKNRVEWKSDKPNYDIRHKHNLTPNRWDISEFRNVPDVWVTDQIKL